MSIICSFIYFISFFISLNSLIMLSSVYILFHHKIVNKFIAPSKFSFCALPLHFTLIALGLPPPPLSLFSFFFYCCFCVLSISFFSLFHFKYMDHLLIFINKINQPVFSYSYPISIFHSFYLSNIKIFPRNRINFQYLWKTILNILI